MPLFLGLGKALAIALLVIGHGYSYAGHAYAESSAEKVSELIKQIGSAAGTPLIDVALTTPDAFLYSGRFDSESGLAHTTTEREDAEVPHFHSASISKLFTAIVIMQLRDEGKLSLDDPVSEYVPAFANSPIQLQHLLTHTSGLRDRKRANGRTTRKEVDTYINSLARQRIKRPPGTDWHYADAGFNLLGHVIENLAGKPFPEVLKDRLLKPLAMKNSDFDTAELPNDTRVEAFNKRGRALKHPWDRAFAPSSGLQTNARDLARFAKAVLRVNADKNANGFLSFKTLQEMVVVRVATKWPGVDQGYGWQLINTDSQPVWRHAGGEAGFESLLAIYPNNGIGIVALGNQKDWPRFRLVEKIRRLLEEAVKTHSEHP